MNLALLWSFTRQELVDRYAGSALGFGWAFIQPLVTLFIFVVIFGQIMSARLPAVNNVYGYSAYLISGMLPWLAFAGTLGRSSTVFVDKAGMLSKVKLSLPTLPVFIVLAESITFVIGFLLFQLFLLFTDINPKPAVLVLPWVFVLQQMLALGLGLIFAVLNVFLRDVREFVSVLVQLWFWLTPIVWAPQAVPAGLLDVLAVLNPMLPITNAYHAMFIPGMEIDYGKLQLTTLVTSLIVGLAYILVRRLERDVRDFL
ncbi:MAG: ABC transporter permease [Thauera sp.]|jgi:lipopolysaccharide transport system permease protein|nr:ABC transporter permease [Thauera sp.]